MLPHFTFLCQLSGVLEACFYKRIISPCEFLRAYALIPALPFEKNGTGRQTADRCFPQWMQPAYPWVVQLPLISTSKLHLILLIAGIVMFSVECRPYEDSVDETVKENLSVLYQIRIKLEEMIYDSRSLALNMICISFLSLTGLLTNGIACPIWW